MLEAHLSSLLSHPKTLMAMGENKMLFNKYLSYQGPGHSYAFLTMGVNFPRASDYSTLSALAERESGGLLRATNHSLAKPNFKSDAEQKMVKRTPVAQAMPRRQLGNKHGQEGTIQS